MKLLFCAFASILVALVLVAGPVQAADRSVGEKLDDTKITTAVKTKLTTDRVKNLVDVGVETNDGIVRLYGKVPTAEDKFEAERIARRVKGVRSVSTTAR